MMENSNRIVVVIPCYNEEQTISKVVGDFRANLPEAEVIVLNNRSTDRSAEFAALAGAVVVHVPRQGKGSVVRHIFRELDADVYLMVDGDDTYPADRAKDLVQPILEHSADMVIGDRLSKGSYASENKRPFHGFGNSLVCGLVNFCFNSNIKDVMTGYRALSRRFAQNVPILSDGFEVETEMTIRCLDRKLSILEIPITYRDRPQGSYSKLNTFHDGIRVIRTVFTILKTYRPFLFSM
jgi:glycosyltransferase involved in cell wall biosynthesis